MAKYVNFDQMVDKIKRELDHSSSSVYFCEDGTKISADVGYVAEWFEDYVIKLHQIPLVDAVDVAPVVRGKWIFDFEFTDSNLYRCSVCGRQVVLFPKENIYECYPYCHCGAKMDGERRTNA